MQVFVKALSGHTIVCEVDSDDGVSKLKKKIEEQTGISPDEQRLIYAGKELEDAFKLSLFNVQNMSMITLVIRLRGGF